MSKNFSKLFLRLSITSFIGLYCLALAPSALARNGNGNGNGNGNSNQSSTSNTTTTTTTSNGNGNGNGNSNQSSTSNTTTTTTTSTTSSVSCSVTDVSIGSTQASACKGPFSGNDTGAQSTLLNDLNQGLFNIGANATWDLVGKSDSSDNFGFEAQNGRSSGTWSLGTALGNGPTTFVISLKTSTSYSTYLFQDIDFSQTGLTGFFNTIGVALNGSGSQGKDLSHASIFKATYAKLPEPPKVKVPEPTASIGLGIVMGSMLISRRRKSN
ncbi:PEP-CTERM sorting domain-containing protein [Anabaena subtropica]|uniref:PEP-CTERM sorting domain-containing protein n=1 Tax=Anabaena subtropica FACHB-260 TaxID=2692884 RepID=A0ABR8CJJ5_9NOST|nr:PEP-CTERM sorting domain-containing protein [Anabaena subtropica]MBD2342998.1 PEP-CTERM sorting domain-containing protein [Anabaena subtropica FACHB-260]